MVGASRLGLDVTYVNTGFVADQVARLATGQQLAGLVCDPEFADRVPSWIRPTATIGEGPDGTPSMMVMVAERPGSSRWAARSSRQSRHVIPTSGTTGEPTYVARTGGGVESVIALLSGLPFRVRQTHLVAAPVFHAWGWLNVLMTMLLSSTVVVTRRFDPKATLSLIEREHCHVLIAVPTMLRRIMDLPPAVRRRFDTSSLSVVAVSGSAISPSLAGAFMDEFGEILFSMYGSTEAGYATVATPVDMRDAPGTAGRALSTVRVRVVDEHRRDRPAGQIGSIQVSSRDAVARVTTEVRRVTVDTGDLGWLYEAGRLFVAGRTDEMVIVGGENVYPIEVEHTLEAHPDIVEAAVVGASDREFGQVLVAHVATRRGATVTAADIRLWCHGRLASFQVPRRVVVHTRLPHGETGKVAKRLLAK
jgi:fatty-acyl-CoA synthase